MADLHEVYAIDVLITGCGGNDTEAEIDHNKNLVAFLNLSSSTSETTMRQTSIKTKKCQIYGHGYY